LQLEIVPLPSKQDLQSFFTIITAKDAPVLASAIHFGAEYLVTGDKRDFDQLKNDPRIPLKIINPVELIRILGQRLAEE